MCRIEYWKPANTSRTPKPSFSASDAASAVYTVHICPRSAGRDDSPAKRTNSPMSSTPWKCACSSKNEPVPALHALFRSLSTMRPPPSRMYFASCPPISTIDRSAPRSGSTAAAAVACATISLSTTSGPSSPKTARSSVATASRPEPVTPIARTSGAHRPRTAVTSRCVASTGLPRVRS